MEEIKYINKQERKIMAEEEKPRWREAEIRRDDIKKLLENTKKLAVMYSELLAVKRTGWENVLRAKIRRQEKENQNG
jgi:hypothetical protein|tara:strand:+ start:288 stop:518 length:231 start_codon:yes stop_codon:yes gene_type:complete